VQKEEVLLLLSRAHRAYGRKSCTAGGEETGDGNEGTKAMAKECWLVSLCFRLFMFFPSARPCLTLVFVLSGFSRFFWVCFFVYICVLFSLWLFLLCEFFVRLFSGFLSGASPFPPSVFSVFLPPSLYVLPFVFLFVLPLIRVRLVSTEKRWLLLLWMVHAHGKKGE